MKKYIAYQLITTTEELAGHTNNIIIDCIIRNVNAESKEEAIGKFSEGTKDVKAVRKLKIECFEFDKLATIE